MPTTGAVRPQAEADAGQKRRALRTVHAQQVLLSAAQTALILGRSKPTFYRLLREEDTFPRPIRVTPESFPQWIKDEVVAWIAARPRVERAESA